MIRKIRKEDKDEYVKMAKSFYISDAVDHNILEKHIQDTFDELMRSDEYAMAYIMELEGNTAGYALLARTFSQEAGGIVLWVEELYVKPEYRCRGLGHEFFSYLEKNLCTGVKRIRLETEESNKRAMAFYKSLGFKHLPYLQMIKTI